jgi:hypothetical protein
MRRHDYAVEVLGGATGANYSTNYREIQGIEMPTTRRVYAYDADGRKVPEPTCRIDRYSKHQFSLRLRRKGTVVPFFRCAPGAGENSNI